MALGALRIFGGLAEGANRGIGNYVALKRQKALDEAARKREEEDLILRRKAEERLAERQQWDRSDRLQRQGWEREDRARAQTDREQAQVDKVRQQQLADMNEPFDAFDKDAEVASTTAPFRSRARAIARDYVKAPEQNDVGIGVLAAENPERQGMQWGKGALQGAYDTQVESAQKAAGDVFARRAKLKQSEADARAASANKPREFAPRLMPGGAVDQVSSWQDSHSQLQGIIDATEHLKGEYYGRYSSAADRARAFANVNDPKITAYRVRLRNQVADYIKSISGAAYTDSERRFLIEIQPNENDAPETILAKARQAQSWLADKTNRRVENYGSVGYKTGNLKGIASGLDAPPVGAEAE